MTDESITHDSDRKSGHSRLLALLLAMAMFVLVVDTSLMNVSISAVVRDLETTVSGVQAAIALEALVSAAFILIGSKVKGGIHGPVPDLANLADGDVLFTQDFRGVYAATLDEWMGGDSAVVLGQKFAPVDVFA